MPHCKRAHPQPPQLKLRNSRIQATAATTRTGIVLRRHIPSQPQQPLAADTSYSPPLFTVQPRLQVQDAPIHALGPPLAVSPTRRRQHPRSPRPLQPTEPGPVVIVIPSRLRGRGRWRLEPGKEAPLLGCISGGVENGLETCLWRTTPKKRIVYQ